MELSELLTGLTYEVLKGTVERKIRKVTNDTENIGERDVFVCIKGYCRDGHDFVGKALERGATALVIQSEELSGSENESDWYYRNERQNDNGVYGSAASELRRTQDRADWYGSGGYRTADS